MSYGHYDCINKAACLFSALWLEFGPSPERLREACRLARYITTDFGVETHSVEVPDIARALCERLRGQPLVECGASVDHGERVFPRALRVGRWSHCFGNLMKNVAKTHEVWPTILDALRDLAKFFQYATWRQHLQQVLHSTVGPLDVLGHFSVSFSKWWYETIAAVLEALLDVRLICEDGIRDVMFASFRDRAPLERVLRHCRDKPLWRFIAVAGREVFTPLEQDRRWGMVCNCPHHLLQRSEGAKHICCDRNGRRFKEALPHTRYKKTVFKHKADTLTIEACEGDPHLHDNIRTMLLQTSTLHQLRWKYLELVPWLFVQADEAPGASHPCTLR